MSTSYRGAVRQLLRDRLLDAGRDQLRDRPWARVTMAEIATAAGVSRQTLYNEFGSRDEFGRALVIREGSRFLDAVELHARRQVTARAPYISSTRLRARGWILARVMSPS